MSSLTTFYFVTSDNPLPMKAKIDVLTSFGSELYLNKSSVLNFNEAASSHHVPNERSKRNNLPILSFASIIR